MISPNEEFIVFLEGAKSKLVGSGLKALSKALKKAKTAKAPKVKPSVKTTPKVNPKANSSLLKRGAKAAAGAGGAYGVGKLVKYGVGKLIDILGDDEIQGREQSDVTTTSYEQRVWPTNFPNPYGLLDEEQLNLIDSSALFGGSTLPDNIKKLLPQLGNWNDDVEAIAEARYEEVFEYWNSVYKDGMKMAYDKQMEKGDYEYTDETDFVDDSVTEEELETEELQ